MKLTREVAQQQAARISVAPALLPQTTEGRREIVGALLRNCTTPEHCERTMTAVLEGSPNIQNVVAEITAKARATREQPTIPAGCARCQLSRDPETGEMLFTSHVVVTIKGYSGACRCDCARGQWLTEQDLKREMESACKSR